MKIDSMADSWPKLSYPEGRESFATLHLWTQIVGKIRLAQTPWLNHSWHVPLYVTARGLTTSLIAHGERSFEMEFDFNRHVLRIEVSDGAGGGVALRPRSVADFYAALTQALGKLGLAVSVDERPCEIAGATRFSEDETHATYDPRCAHRLWQVLLRVDRVFKEFRTGFLGKCSPVHFFWGSFDLAVTRFSGRAAPAFPGKAPGVSRSVMREAYSHEVSSAGFWPGGASTTPVSIPTRTRRPRPSGTPPSNPPPRPSIQRSGSSCCAMKRSATVRIRARLSSAFYRALTGRPRRRPTGTPRSSAHPEFRVFRAPWLTGGTEHGDDFAVTHGTLRWSRPGRPV